MFGNASKPSRVYAFGAKLHKDAEAQAIELLHSAHRYRNQLVELELTRRANVDALLAELSPSLATVEKAMADEESALEETLAIAAKERAKTGKKEAGSATAQAIKGHRATLKLLRAQRKELRSALFASEEFKR